MKTKENVYGRTAGAEDAATAGGKEEEALTALGKFKDVNALARAYESLQAEFTRRSQRLKELERAVENSSEKVEKALSNVIPVERQSDFRHRVVHFGREICSARSPKCSECFVFSAGLCKGI